MKQDQFFKPTLLQKKYLLLDLIEKNSFITQREIANVLGISVALVNKLLNDFENEQLLIKETITSKNVTYLITDEGINQKKVLNIGFLKHVQLLYQAGKENIDRFIDNLIKTGFTRLYIYGAGEVSEIILSVLKNRSDDMKVLGIIDDDEKIRHFHGHKVMRRTNISQKECDGVLIASYAHHDQMHAKLLQDGLPAQKIVEFF